MSVEQEKLDTCSNLYPQNVSNTKSKDSETFVKSENTYQGCHIREHMTLNSCCKPAKQQSGIK